MSVYCLWGNIQLNSCDAAIYINIKSIPLIILQTDT